MNLKSLYDSIEEEIIAWRRWFHQRPEVSYEERETAAEIRRTLEGMGIPCEELPPNHGIAATIRGSGAGKTIAMRADIDALPVREETGLPFASENEGVMHACGHDAHIAMLLGAAKALNQVRDELNGTVKLVFQVAEEVGGGSDEVLEYFDAIGGIDGVIGLHIWSTIPEGQILLLPGTVFAGGKSYDVTIHGRGGHGGRPDLTNDPIKAACDLAMKFTSIPSNFYDVLDHSVVNVGRIASGTQGNIIPSEARLQGGIRWYKDGGADKIVETMRRMAAGVGTTHGVRCEMAFSIGVPPVVNDPGMVERAKALLPEVAGLRLADQTDPICAGDNYGYYLEKYPGFYGILGAGREGEEPYPQHHPKFDLDKRSFRKGSEFMARCAVDFLARGA